MYAYKLVYCLDLLYIIQHNVECEEHALGSSYMGLIFVHVTVFYMFIMFRNIYNFINDRH